MQIYQHMLDLHTCGEFGNAAGALMIGDPHGNFPASSEKIDVPNPALTTRSPAWAEPRVVNDHGYLKAISWETMEPPLVRA